MKLGRGILAVSLFLILVALAATACGSNQSNAKQQVQVTQGDIALKTSGSSKVGVGTDAKPSLVSGAKIAKLSVKEGDIVSKGQVLARLETDNLVSALYQAQVAQAQSEVAVTQSQTVMTQAQTSLTAAQFNLDRTQTVADIKDSITTLQNRITAAQVNLDQAKASNDISGINVMTSYLASIQIELLNQQYKLQTLLSQPQYAGVLTYNILGQTYDRLTVEDVRLKQLAVESAHLSITQAQQNIELAKRTLDQAKKAVTVAQTQIDNATITSPIDGIAVTVNVKEGDIVSPSSALSGPPIYIIDPTTMQVAAQIDEVDIANVKLGQKVNITLDSTPNVIYEGKVNSIAMAPVSNPQNSGVVVYEVEVGFVNPPPPEVKLGMSATADIISAEKTGVLLIPSRAIREDGLGNPTVDVMVANKVETRSVQLGISDGVNTEVVSGLKAGDKVVIIPATQNSGLFGQ
jgi:RND family efflux transporter MFP subunit